MELQYKGNAMKSYLLVLIGVVIFISGCSTPPSSSSVEPVYGKTNPTPQQNADAKVKRFGSIIELLPEKEQLYRKLHADVWPQVLAAISKANIQNYNIFTIEISGKKYLFSYLEYTGDNLEKDFASIGDDVTTRDKWWPITDACQKKMPATPKGEQWTPLEMLMHIP